MPSYFAPCKVNLTLEVLGKRNDGYHELRTVMQALSFGDEITVFPAQKGLVLTCNRKEVPLDESNTARKAVRALEQETGSELPVWIHLEKAVPSEAGLGGGSADAMAVLVAVNEIYDLGLDREALLRVGASVGADVPFFLEGGTQVCEGIGERLQPRESAGTGVYVLAKPHFGCPTAQVFQAFDSVSVTKVPDHERLLTALKGGELSNLSEVMANQLEAAAADPSIASIREKLLAAGAEVAQMTGSGSCVFGIFDSILTAEEASEALRREGIWSVVATPSTSGVRRLDLI